MPNYTFKNTETEEVWTETLTISERDRFLEENSHIQQLIVSAPALGDPAHLGRMKPDDAFKDRLKEIKSSHRGSTINTF